MALEYWSGSVPAPKTPFYGIQIPFLELMYRSTELSKNPLDFEHLSLESLFCFLHDLAHNKYYRGRCSHQTMPRFWTGHVFCFAESSRSGRLFRRRRREYFVGKGAWSLSSVGSRSGTLRRGRTADYNEGRPMRRLGGVVASSVSTGGGNAGLDSS